MRARTGSRGTDPKGSNNHLWWKSRVVHDIDLFHTPDAVSPNAMGGYWGPDEARIRGESAGGNSLSI